LPDECLNAGRFIFIPPTPYLYPFKSFAPLMLQLTRTSSGNDHFKDLVALLDQDLRVRDGDDHEGTLVVCEGEIER
jgi:hypothetical protein